MLKELIRDFKRIKDSEKINSDEFLCGVFLICEVKDLKNTPWQFDFYNKEKDSMRSYKIEEQIEETDNSEVFKNENIEIEELNLEEIKIDFEELEPKLTEILNNYKEIAVKISIIIQKQNHIPIWNIIYITKNFNLINIKINAIDGKILEDKVVPLISF